MEVKRNTKAIEILAEFWEKQHLEIAGAAPEEIITFEISKKCTMPSDFKEFYSRVNGMQSLYPNDTDENGFLFYPIEGLNPATVEFKNPEMANSNRIIIFVEYMYRSWWYGVDVIDKDNYVIGIIPYPSFFKPLCSSLSEFIELYISDSPKLYDYKQV
jgi:hypothetical protein